MIEKISRHDNTRNTRRKATKTEENIQKTQIFALNHENYIKKTAKTYKTQLGKGKKQKMQLANEKKNIHEPEK